MADYSEFYTARKVIAEILEKDFIGPVTNDEVLTEFPLQYYIMGKLYPQDDDNEALDLARNPLLENAAETYDASISLSNQKNPSSMGITCTIKPDVNEILVSGSYAFYNLVSYENAKDLGIDVSKWDVMEKKPADFWLRQPYNYREVIQLSSANTVEPRELENGLQLHVYTHSVLDTGERVITIALVNCNQAGKELSEQNQKAAFQPVIKVSGINGEPIFTSVDKKVNLTTDPELLELELLYYGVYCYGQGHGCSVEWDTENPDPLWVASTFFPTFNLRQMKASEFPGLTIFNMKRLFTEAPYVLINELRQFIADYKKWIDGIETQSLQFSGDRKMSAERNIKKCRDAYSQINKSIDLLEKSCNGDGVVFRAFQLANEAMYIQRVRTLTRNRKPIDSEKINWYPFQLAFFLHEMVSFIEPSGEERKKVDLLWFPTGGGKTEAYLGISAFVIFLRRLRNTQDDGVTIIMRYTLRLLTLQQFERASILIFACEQLREKYNLGGSEIAIGLWVGGKLTPNSLEAARASINKQQRGALISGDEENPCQIQICPWCGVKITAQNYSVDMAASRMIIRCPNPGCEFHFRPHGLPVHIIDAAIYEHLPSFIVATVDKFSQIPLNDKPAALFGITSGKKPPELIIQDELHLISGPLGTMTGIYEAAVTRLCEHDGIQAKVIASTATIRNAENQIRSLYGRSHTQFPPQGISISDSFFASESAPEERPARRYFGVMGIGTTATTTLIRVNAAMLFATRYLEKLGFSETTIDNFWSIIVYFNSLRELGGASTQILDDVQSRFGYLAKTKFATVYPGIDADISYDNIVELTSRMNNSDITKVIQEGLKRSYRSDTHVDVYDFLLASNMISVGVDVGRLGAMVVAGQPKTNAEYIQATSRVGRNNPGIVVTVYNSSRSRDRSHYEQFLKYHTAMYRYVEATSLTPFSDRARDRGLHALFVSLCRYLVSGLLHNGDAINFDANDPKVREIEQLILDYVKTVDPEELSYVKDELKIISDLWEDAAVGTLVYRSFKNEKSLLKGDTEDDRFRTMNSMRNVDGQAGIYLLGR